MASQELIEKVNSYKAILTTEYRSEVMRATIQAINAALQTEKDEKYGLDLCSWTKKYIEDFVLRNTNRDFWYLEQYLFSIHQNNEVVEQYYDVLKEESWFKLESFILYMEKNRDPSKRFYAPRINPLRSVVADLEDLEFRRIKFYGLSMASRTGKALAYDTPILTRNGWKKHGDLTIRDEVIGIDGEWKKILAIHNPCRMEYKVTFTDGESVVCHGNHEWVVCDRHHMDKQVTIETKEMFGNEIEKNGRLRFAIPKKESLSGSHQALWVTPYALGAWLGDGRNKNPDICGAESDYAIVQRILDDGYTLAWDTKHKTTGVRYYGFSGLRKGLQKYGMCHSRTRTLKHIPSEYLIADEEQRLDLLAGLLDTDGTLKRDEHRYAFTTNEFVLKDDFVSLISTFGWRTCVTEYKPTTSSSGITAKKPYWVISFNPDRYIPCQLERKQLHEYSKQRRVHVEKIEKIENYVMGNCITVEDGIYCCGKTLKPTHNSTICIFYLAWHSLRKPNSHSAMGGHSGILAKGFYKELMNLFTTDEYTFEELFAHFHSGHVCIRDKSAEDFTITLDQPDRFATITCRGIDGTWTGAVDVSWDGILYVDDLVRDREHSLSAQRMESTWQEYLNKMVDRKSGYDPQDGTFAGACELMVGTLWNVLDPLERMRKQYEGNPLYRFRRIPALDENEESNYKYVYSTDYLLDMRERLDDAEWMAKWMQKPYVREGILFQADELRYFNGILPDGDFKRVAVVDIAWGGGDSLSMPIGAEYENGDVYIYDWVFNSGAKEITLPLVVGQIINNEIRATRFEGNQGGELYQQYVDERLIANGWKCSTSSRKAPNRIAKKEKIIAYSGDIKRKFVFLQSMRPTQEQLKKDAELGIKRYVRSKEYQNAMDEFTTFVTIGDNEHDDAADGITQLEMFLEGSDTLAKIEIPINPLRGGYY